MPLDQSSRELIAYLLLLLLAAGLFTAWFMATRRGRADRRRQRRGRQTRLDQQSAAQDAWDSVVQDGPGRA